VVRRPFTVILGLTVVFLGCVHLGLAQDDLVQNQLPLIPTEMETSHEEVKIGTEFQYHLDLNTFSLPEGSAEKLDSKKWTLELQGGAPSIRAGWAFLDPQMTDEGFLKWMAIPLIQGDLPVASFVLKFGKEPIGQTKKLPPIRVLMTEDTKQKPYTLVSPRGLGLPLWLLQLGVLFGMLMGGGLLGLLLFFGIRWWRGRRKLEKYESPLSLDEKALRDLRVIEEKRFLIKGDFKEHYFGVSEVVKTYLSARFHFDAVESTTSEMMARLKDEVQSGRLTSERFQELEILFDELDLVKFTDHSPKPGESTQLLPRARNWVVATRPPVPVVHLDRLEDSK